MKLEELYPNLSFDFHKYTYTRAYTPTHIHTYTHACTHMILQRHTHIHTPLRVSTVTIYTMNIWYDSVEGLPLLVEGSIG